MVFNFRSLASRATSAGRVLGCYASDCRDPEPISSPVQIAIQGRLTHVNIIKLHEVLLTPTHLCIKLEYAPGGELFDYLRKQARPLIGGSLMPDGPVSSAAC